MSRVLQPTYESTTEHCGVLKLHGFVTSNLHLPFFILSKSIKFLHVQYLAHARSATVLL